MNTPECYITDRSKAPIPARVVRETKSTVTVEGTYPSGVAFTRTFNKRKRYGEDWIDPRNDGVTSLSERGTSSWYGPWLRFDVAKVEAEYAESQRDNQRELIRRVMNAGTTVEDALTKASITHESPTYKAWLTFKVALQVAYMEAGGTPTP